MFGFKSAIEIFRAYGYCNLAQFSSACIKLFFQALCEVPFLLLVQQYAAQFLFRTANSYVDIFCFNQVVNKKSVNNKASFMRKVLRGCMSRSRMIGLVTR